MNERNGLKKKIPAHNSNNNGWPSPNVFFIDSYLVDGCENKGVDLYWFRY